VPPLNVDLFDRVVRLLLPFMETEDDRQTELHPVVYGRPVSDRIQWEGAPKHFTVQLVRLLSYDELLLVLKRLSLGDEQRAEIADVCALVGQEAAARRSPAPVAAQPERPLVQQPLAELPLVEQPPPAPPLAEPLRHTFGDIAGTVIGPILLAILLVMLYQVVQPRQVVLPDADPQPVRDQTTEKVDTGASQTETAVEPKPKAAVDADLPVLWPDNTVPYVVDDDLPSPQRVVEAISYYEAHTNIRFVPRIGGLNYVSFVSGAGCSAAIGMQKGAQRLTAGPNCTVGTILHDIGHTLGLAHEESRPDRDRFVRIHWENVQPGLRHNFTIRHPSINARRPYDYGSIMHMPRTAFSVNGEPTIEPLDPNVQIGQRNALSPSDIALINSLYPPAGK
jgi:hypothetical protein